jgi:nucleoside phosphorylase
MIHIFCALPCEAEPIIKHYKLSVLKQFDLFRIYQSKDKNISLTVTGIGKINAASAVSYHHACLESQASDIWLNIGIAGHAVKPVAEALLINKITDHQNGICWYPQILFKSPCECTHLLTLDKPSADYQDSLFDMEASGFYQMAIRLGTAELVHCLKIISDNSDNPSSTVNADIVKKLISENLETIDSILNLLKPFSTEMTTINTEPNHYSSFMTQWHFTKSESVQLSRLLRQWSIRLTHEDVMQSVIDLKTGKAVLNVLREKINGAKFVIYD